MSLFAQRFTTPAADRREPAWRYHERRGLSVDSEGRAVVERGTWPGAKTQAREDDPAPRLQTTKASADKQLLAMDTKTAAVEDKDPYPGTLGSSHW